MNVIRALVGGLLFAGLLLGGFAVPAAASASSHDGSCTAADSDGVTVVVDYAGLGGGMAIRCATGLSAASRGSDALAAAGFSWTSVSSQSGFACRINGRPAADESIGNANYHEACADTPPADAYWSYWKSSGNGTWDFSSSGLSSSRVRLGGFEGWSFSTGPKIAPGMTPVTPPAPAPPAPAPRAAEPPAAEPPAAAPPAAQPPVAEPPAAPPAAEIPAVPAQPAASSAARSTTSAAPVVAVESAPQVATDGSVGAVPSSDPSEVTSPTASAPTSESPDTTRSSASLTTTDAASSDAEVAAAQPAPSGSSAGPILTTVAGVALIGGMTGAAMLIARRRRIGD